MTIRLESGLVLGICVLFCPTLPVCGQGSAMEDGVAKVITHGTNAPGTAFVVALQDQSAWLLTSAHVVQGDASPEVEFQADPANPKPASVRYPQFDSSYGLRGLAILVVANPPPGVRVLPASETDLGLRDEVVVEGYLASNNGMFTTAKTDVGSADSTEIVVNTFTDDGFSGGPVMHNSAVAGIIFGQRPNKGVALPTNVIQSYLKGKVTWGTTPAPKPQQDYWVDQATHLMWTRKNSRDDVTQGEARQYCTNLKMDGFADWRLPTIDELEAILDDSGPRVFQRPKGEISLDTGFVWSSSPGRKPGEWWAFFFWGGTKRSTDGDYAEVQRALCVRLTDH